MRRCADGVSAADAGSRPQGTVPTVLVLVTRDQRRGAELSAVTVSDRLSALGFRVVVRSLAPGGAGPGLGVLPLGARPLSVPTLVRLRNSIRSSDVVVASGSKTLPASVVAGLALDTPLIYQNIGDPLYWAPDGWRHRMVRALLRRTDAVAAVSGQAAGALARDFGVPADRITVLRNARDRHAYQPASAAERVQARARLGLPPEVPVVVQVAALSREKRIDLAVAALQRVPLAHLVVVGTGPLRAHLEQLAAAVAPGRVHFLGSMSDVRPAYAAGDAVLLTSDSEGVPGALIEGGLCGLPAVATDVGFVRDVVQHGVTGELVPPDDVNAVSRGLVRVLPRSAALGRAARALCLERFDLDRVVQGWADLIVTVAASSVGGSRVQPAD